MVELVDDGVGTEESEQLGHLGLSEVHGALE